VVKPSLFRRQVEGGAAAGGVDIPDAISENFGVDMFMSGKYYFY
jgi:hypothetical protein